jgi:pimeloyl-ACP methyl ester carboxylesterase
MGTESVARDLDILREAVGDERLNYVGVSYGTFIGAMYADFFTSRVGYMVLDSGIAGDGLDTPDVTQADYDAQARDEGRELDEAVADFAESCGSECSLGADGAAVSAAIVHLLDGLERRPLPTELESLPRLTEGWGAEAVRAGLEDSSAWPYLVEALESAGHGDGSDLAWLAMADVGREEDGSYPGASFGKNHLPVTCADWPPTKWSAMEPSPQVLREFPLLGRLSPRSGDPCAAWPGPRRQNLLVGAELATPVVVIGNEHDPVTSIDGTEYLASMLLRSRLVRVDAYGHGAYGSGNACADRIVGAYLVSGTAPEDDTRCPAE